MKKISILIAILAIPTGLILVLNGCSLVGLLIGSAIDKDKPKYREVQGWEIVEIKPKNKITVYMKDNEVINGKFMKATKNNPQEDSIFNVAVIKTSGGDIRKLPFQEIDHVRVENKRIAATTGFLIGLGIDVIIVVSVGSALSGLGNMDFDFSTPSASSSESCPYIYSYDGSAYRMDGEIYSGAFFKAAQRSDWDNLDWLQEKNGVYRLMMTNELNEIQYVDNLKLLAIDHPKGTYVYPSYSGELFTVSQPELPKSAVTVSGTDMLSDVRTNDDAYWLANPFGRNPDNPADLTDGILLEFDKPVAAASAALVLRVMNTPWSSIAQKELLKLHGENLPQWYETLNTSPEVYKLLSEAMIRESTLKINLWDGARWIPAGFVWEVGPAIAKDVAVELDLRSIPGNILKIKLDAAPGVWIVNSVAADFTYSNAKTTVKELSLQKATDNHGRNIVSLLQETDGKYYEMPNTGDKAELEYAVPAQMPDMKRSYILKSNGYYTMHVDAKGEADPQAFNRMLQEPGAFTQYVLRDLNEKMYR